MMQALAVNAATSALSSSLAAESDQNDGCSCITSNWRMIPALATLVVLVVAVAAMAILRHNMMIIPLGVGVICSLYLVYLTYHYGLLSTFETLNRQLDSEVQSFGKENSYLSKSNRLLAENVEKFTTQNDKLKVQVTELTAANTAYEEKLARHEGQIKKLTEEVQSLGASNQALKRSLEALQHEVDRLDGLNKSLDETQKELTALLTNEATSLDQLNKEIEALRKKSGLQFAEIEGAATRCNGHLDQLKARLEAFGKSAEGAVAASSTFQSTVLQFTTFLKEMLTSAPVQALREELCKTHEEIGAARGVLTELNKQTSLIRAEVSKLQNVDARLIPRIEQLLQLTEKTK